jgi:UDP-glucose 4-epimerase
MRDYIHVSDLARGHVAALRWLTTASTGPEGVIDAFNLGTGEPVSVLQMIAAYEAASGKKIKYSIGPRRPGDVGAMFSNPAKAESILHWRAEKTLVDMCKDSWRWASSNPDGYAGTTDTSAGTIAGK